MFKKSRFFYLISALFFLALFVLFLRPFSQPAAFGISLTPTPKPGELTDGPVFPEEIDPEEIGTPLGFLMVLLGILFVLFLLIIGVVIIGLFILAIVFAGLAVFLGVSTVVGLVRKSWQDGLKALASQIALAAFTVSGVGMAWLLEVLGLFKIQLWIAGVIGASIGFCAGLAVIFAVWGVMKALESAQSS